MLPQTKVAWWIAISILSSFTTVTAESNCAHVLNQGGAFINSMNFPDLYPNRHICTWQITVPTGDTVSLRFSHFNTEICCDRVEVYDGSIESPLMATFTGYDLPELIVSSGNSMLITFKPDSTVQRSGFAGVLTTNGHSLTLDGTNGTIHSPNYPAPFPRDSLFTWTITVDVGDIIAMEFHNMSTLNSDKDSVRVYDGNSQFSLSLGGFNRNNPPSDVIKSTGNQMFVVFYQIDSPASNFVGEFKSYPAKSCMEQGNHLCDQICTDMNRTFECSCIEGFQVSVTNPYKCQECDEWTYGMACSRSCSCDVKTTNYCNKTNGRCMCNDGWTGIDCSTVQECDEWTYGVLCSSTCLCNVNTTTYCNKTNGRCMCKDGWTSIDCFTVQECDEWTYGVLCSSTCLCNVNTTNYCNKKDGTCVCNDGWTDANCSTEALPTSSNSYEGPTLDEEIYWAIIGVLGFLLLTAVIVIAVLVYKWNRKEKKAMGIAPPPPVETMPLEEIVRRCSSDAQTQSNTPSLKGRDSCVCEEMTDNSEYEVPIVQHTSYTFLHCQSGRPS